MKSEKIFYTLSFKGGNISTALDIKGGVYPESAKGGSRGEFVPGPYGIL